MKPHTPPLLALLALQCASITGLQAAVITPSPVNSGYYWYERQTWMGGNNTNDGFAYGDSAGLVHAQNNYQYYGGADRYFERKDAFFQIDLSSIDGDKFSSASFNFYVTANSTVANFLRHLDTQTVAATGDAGQRLAGDANVASTTSFTLGWNSIDVTSFIASDIAKSYNYAAFSIPQFSQVQDENRMLTLYGASTDVTIGGLSARPFLQVTAIPEPSSYAMGVGGLALAFVFWRRRRQ